ncbi:winged helix-turn-helix transcriptional regulator [Phenylobacterium sp.]|uniref:winged helix-turn-helix transcriptional regulator n=1 Tax=Phenylobacterium sp. TaxID=1871053 RepID=UPI0035B3E998
MTDPRLDQPKVPRIACVADVQDAIAVLEGRWKMRIVAHLYGEPVLRFSELRRAIPEISQKMLIQQLRGLEEDGVVLRTVHPQVPPKVEYQLSELGRALGPVFLALLDWARIRRELTQGDEPQALEPAGA